MRQLFFAVACVVLTSCEDILPVENVDLCEGDEPNSSECDQCAGPTKPAGCPQCRNAEPAEGCENHSSGVSGAGNGAGTSGHNAIDGGGGGSGGRTAGSNAGGNGGSGTGGSGGAAGGGMSGSGGSAGSDVGGSGGAGGTAGSAGSTPACDGHDDCTNPMPQCTNRGRCVSCNTSSACTANPEGAYCDQRSGSAMRGLCLECIGNEHCTDPLKPECNANGKCVACSGDEACTGRSAGSRCDLTNSSPTKGQCVLCISNADCPDITNPECTTARVCAPCTSNAACTDRPDTTQCNLYDGASAKGHCVRCTGANEAVCGGTSCKRSTGTCTQTNLGSVGSCEPCEADTECGATARCVTQTFANQTIGAFCFFTDPNSNNCADANDERKPYSSRLTNATSIDGAAGPFCVPATTCPAVTDANGKKDCDINEECGVSSVDDGHCLGAGKCSYGCDTHADCLPGLGSFSTCSNLPGGYCQ
jgi:hypothetical protein